MNPAEIALTLARIAADALAEYHATRHTDEVAAVARFKSRVASEVAACLADEAAMTASATARDAEIARVRAGLDTPVMGVPAFVASDG